jgi:hypothetical protein
MFVPCVIKRNRNNQHNAQIYTTALFHMLAPTCFGSSMPSSGSFWIRLSYMKNTDRYGGLSYNVVKWPVCRSVLVFSTFRHLVQTQSIRMADRHEANLKSEYFDFCF